MRLPELGKVEIPPEKIIDYLLSPSHRAGRGKAWFFGRYGFARESWQTLATALRRHINDHAVTKVEETPFGIRYLIEGTLRTPSGRTPRVRSVWFVEGGHDSVRFVTAYPLDINEGEDRAGT
jgi:hypothetical protein